MEQNDIQIEFEGKSYQFYYYYSPPQDQTPEHIHLRFQSDILIIGNLIIENISNDFNSLQQFNEQLQKDIQENKYNFNIVRDQETNFLWFNYFVNFQIGKHNTQVRVFCQLQQLEKSIEEIQQEKLQECQREVYQSQITLDKNQEILIKQQDQYQHLQQSAEKYLQNQSNFTQIEKDENKLKDVENRLQLINNNIGEVKPTINELKQLYYKEIKFEDILKVYLYNSSTLSQSTNKQPELKIQDGFAISQAYSDKQQLKFKIEDSDTNFTFGITSGNQDYQSVNQIINNDQAQYFFVPNGDYKHGQRLYENFVPNGDDKHDQKLYEKYLQHQFGNDDALTLIVDPSSFQISVKINDVLVTNIRNKNMAKNYKIFISVKDKQNLEGLIL